MEEGILQLIEKHNSTAEDMVAALLKTGVLPNRLKRYQHLIIETVKLSNESHSSVARKLRVTRWTIAAWRERLGITTHESKNQPQAKKKVK
jgi:hypothetical protein